MSTRGVVEETERVVPVTEISIVVSGTTGSRLLDILGLAVYGVNSCVPSVLDPNLQGVSLVRKFYEDV